MYKVTNKMKDVRKFWDGYLGREVFVEPKKSVNVIKPPEENSVWKVEKLEQKDEKVNKPENKSIRMEAKKNDSSSNI